MEHQTPTPITGHTALICLLGSPCAHSISPMMHNASFEALGLDYRYLAFDVNEATLPTAVAGLKVLGARGFNLTMPDKNLMCSLCDKLSPAAEIIGAVNTIVNDNGVLTGYTTDGLGYMHAVEDAGHNIILEIEIDGALNVKKLYPDALLIFLLPPSIKELEKRLRERGTESEDVIADRIKRASEESKVIREYDYVVVNDTIDDCVSTIHNIVEIEGLKVYRQEEVIHNIEQELSDICSK